MSTPKKPAAEQVKQAAADVAEQAKIAASTVARDAADTARGHAEAAKSSMADEVSGVASALRTAADQLRSGSPQERTFGQIAEGLADASDAMREKDLGELVRDVTTFARRNPMVFLGGAVLIGFAATRFAKASSEPETASLPAPDHYSNMHGDV